MVEQMGRIIIDDSFSFVIVASMNKLLAAMKIYNKQNILSWRWKVCFRTENILFNFEKSRDFSNPFYDTIPYYYNIKIPIAPMSICIQYQSWQSIMKKQGKLIKITINLSKSLFARKTSSTCKNASKWMNKRKR